MFKPSFAAALLSSVLSAIQLETSQGSATVVEGPGIGMLEAKASKWDSKEYKPDESGCILKSMKTCHCPKDKTQEEWQLQLTAATMTYTNCDSVHWNKNKCTEKCVKYAHKFDSRPVAFTASKYDVWNDRYAFPAGFSIETESAKTYAFGDTSYCAVQQGTTKIEGQIVGFQVKESQGTVDHWSLLIESDTVKVAGPGAGNLAKGADFAAKKYTKHAPEESGCVLKKVKVCTC